MDLNINGAPAPAGATVDRIDYAFEVDDDDQGFAAKIARLDLTVPLPPPPPVGGALPGRTLFDFARFDSLDPFGNIYTPVGGQVGVEGGDLVCWAPGMSGGDTPKALVEMFPSPAIALGQTLIFEAEMTVVAGDPRAKWITVFDAEESGGSSPGTRFPIAQGKPGIQQKFGSRLKSYATHAMVERGERFAFRAVLRASVVASAGAVVYVDESLGAVLQGATCASGMGWAKLQFGLTANGDAGALGLRVHRARASVV